DGTSLAMDMQAGLTSFQPATHQQPAESKLPLDNRGSLVGDSNGKLFVRRRNPSSPSDQVQDLPLLLSVSDQKTQITTKEICGENDRNPHPITQFVKGESTLYVLCQNQAHRFEQRSDYFDGRRLHELEQILSNTARSKNGQYTS